MKQRTIALSVLLMLMGSKLVSFSWGQPDESLPGYSNVITNVIYSVYQDVHQVTLRFEKAPVAFYDPMTFAESKKTDYKRYFLPRVTLKNKDVQLAIDNINKLEKSKSMYFEIDRVHGSYPGYDVHVVADDNFQIEKKVDTALREVYFKVRLKKRM